MEVRNGMPQIGIKATEFNGITEKGTLNHSSDFANHWIVLFHNPANAKEFMNFWKKTDDFQQINCQLIESPKASEVANAREIFFIDPEGVVRTVIYSSAAHEIDFNEIKRTLIGLQAVDTYGIALPSDWCPGEEVVIHKASPCPVAKESINNALKMFLN